MTDSELCVIHSDGVTRITLNRPDKRNALTRLLLTDLLIQLRKTAADSQTRLILLNAAGPVFCAGMDLAEMQAVAVSDEPEQFWRQDAQLYCDVLTAMLEAPQPIVAILQGPVLAGGVGLTMACDLILSAENAFFSLPEPQRGITASIVIPLLAYRVGAAAASTLLMSGERLSAQRAHALGLCHDIVPADLLAERTESLVKTILAGSPQALAQSKHQLRAAAGPELTRQLEQAVIASGEMRGTDDAREGLAAFLVKRPPRWTPTDDEDT